MHYTNEHESRLALESLKGFRNFDAEVGGDCGFEIPEDLQALERQPRLVLVRVVHADESARLARRARAEPPPLEEQHVPRAEPGQVEGRARAVGASPDDDDVSAGHSVASPFR